MRRLWSLGRDRRGVGAVEFALAAPVLFAVVIGVAQLGILFFANAGLHNAVAEGARLATIFPRPTDEEITAAIMDSRFGMQRANIVADPEIVHGTDGNGYTYADISLSYRVPLNFIFFETPPITLSESRRVFTQPETL